MPNGSVMSLFCRPCAPAARSARVAPTSRWWAWSMISREPTIERLATAQSLLLAPFGLNESHLSARAGGDPPTRSTTPTCISSTPAPRLESGRGHRQDRLFQHRPGRGRARGQRREDGVCLFRRYFRSLAAGCGAHGALDCGVGAEPAREDACPQGGRQPLAVSRRRPDCHAGQHRQGRAAGQGREAGPRQGPARGAGHGRAWPANTTW
jgi:hypothetical protein